MSRGKKPISDRGALAPAPQSVVVVSPSRNGPSTKNGAGPEISSLTVHTEVPPAVQKAAKNYLEDNYRSTGLVTFRNPTRDVVRASRARPILPGAARQPMPRLEQEPIRPIFLRADTIELHRTVVVIRSTISEGLNAQNDAAFTKALQTLFNQESFQRGFGFDFGKFVAEDGKGAYLRRQFLADAGKIQKLNSALDRLLAGLPPHTWMVSRHAPK